MACVHFQGYQLDSVYLATNAELRGEISAFWQREQAVPDPAEAARRAHEVVFTVRRKAGGELAGVSTVGLVNTTDGRVFYAYRMFLRPADRMPYLMWAVICATRDFLRGFQHPHAKPQGILHINENPKLMRPGARRFFARHGYRWLGTNSFGQDVWLTEFT